MAPLVANQAERKSSRWPGSCYFEFSTFIGGVMEKTSSSQPPTQEMTRRECVSVLGAVTANVVLGGTIADEMVKPSEAAPADLLVTTHLRVNGQPRTLSLDPRVTLLDSLREHMGLTGTKKGCDHGQCGACTVLVNGRRINSCLSLAVTHDGDDVVTIEGLAHNGALLPVQAAFIEHDGFQCGYCTSGQICSAVALLTEAHRGDASFVTADISRMGPIELSDAEIRERMSGNICRCGAYPGIVAAVRSAGIVQQADRAKEERR
jgi:xanthine dehydrogenase YagT iron-sulfur-binding subunit